MPTPPPDPAVPRPDDQPESMDEGLVNALHLLDPATSVYELALLNQETPAPEPELPHSAGHAAEETAEPAP